MVSELALEQQDVSLSCTTLKVSRSGYYKWLDRPVSARRLSNSKLALKIKSMWEDSRKIYGAPRIHESLKKAGEKVGKNRVARVMKENGIVGVGKKKFRPCTTTSNHNLPVAERIFKTEEQLYLYR